MVQAGASLEASRDGLVREVAAAVAMLAGRLSAGSNGDPSGPSLLVAGSGSARREAATAPRSDSLALPLGLSVVMTRHDATPADVAAALIEARAAVLQWSTLDPVTEPTPLPVGDDRVRALNLAAYLADLLDRAAAARGVTRIVAVEQALGPPAIAV